MSSKRKSSSNSSSSNRSGRIKGNVSSTGEKIQHGPDSPYYDRTKVNPEKGDLWFDSPQQAGGAGFRKPKR